MPSLFIQNTEKMGHFLQESTNAPNWSPGISAVSRVKVPNDRLSNDSVRGNADSESE